MKLSRRTVVVGGLVLATGALAREAPRRQAPAEGGGGALRLSPKEFGAAGDGQTDDTEALTALAKAANAAAAARRPVEIHISGRHAVSRTIMLRPGGAPFSVIGQGSGTGFVALGNARMDCLALRGGGSGGQAQRIAAPAAFGATTLALSGGAALAAGDVLLVSNATGYDRDRRDCLVEVVSAAGGRVTLKRPLPFAINPSQPATATKLALVRGVKVVNLSFDGRKASGGATGLTCAFLRDPFVESIRSNGFSRQSGYGQVYGPCLGGRFHDLDDTGSGWQGNSNSIKFVNISGAQITDVAVNNSNGFGIGITFVSDSRLGGLKSIASAGRGLKLFGACKNEFTTLIVNNSGKTGLSISSGSSHNTFSGVEARGNRETGVWLNGTANDSNRFTRINASGNGIDLMVAATAPLVDRGNVFTGALTGFDKVQIEPATQTVFQR